MKITKNSNRNEANMKNKLRYEYGLYLKGAKKAAVSFGTTIMNFKEFKEWKNSLTQEAI